MTFTPGDGLDKKALAAGIFDLLVAIENAQLGSPSAVLIKRMLSEGLAELVDKFVKSGKVETIVDTNVSTTVPPPIAVTVVTTTGVGATTGTGTGSGTGTGTGEGKIV